MMGAPHWTASLTVTTPHGDVEMTLVLPQSAIDRMGAGDTTSLVAAFASMGLDWANEVRVAHNIRALVDSKKALDNSGDATTMVPTDPVTDTEP